MQQVQGSTKRDNASSSKGQNNPYLGLIESLAGDVIVNYARGRRVLDAGARSERIAQWVDRVSPYPLSRWPQDGDAHDGQDVALPYPDRSFDLAYSMWAFSQLGDNEDNSRALARELLEECARVVRPGGYLLVHARNAVSLRGAWAHTGRQLISYSLGSQRPRYERWDSLSEFVRLLPPILELVDGHGLGVLTLNARLLKVPILGRIGHSIAWRLRDSRSFRHLAGDILCVVRRVPDPENLPQR